MNIRTISRTIIAVTAGIALAVGVAVIGQTYSPMPQNPPAGNAPVPVYSGQSADQIKTGTLATTGLRIDPAVMGQTGGAAIPSPAPLLLSAPGIASVGATLTGLMNVSNLAAIPDATQRVCATVNGDLGVCPQQLPPVIPPVQPTVTLLANGQNVAALTLNNPGGPLTLSWTSTDTTICSSAWAGTGGPSGSSTVNVTQTTTYTVTCYQGPGLAGLSASDSVTVTVGPAPVVIYGSPNVYAWTNNGPDTLDFYVQIDGNNQPYLKYEIESYHPFYSGNGWHRVSAFTFNQQWLASQAAQYNGQYQNMPATLAMGPSVNCANGGGAYSSCTQQLSRPATTSPVNSWRDTRMGGHGDHDMERAGMPQPFRIRAYDAANTALPWRYFCPEDVLNGNPPYNLLPPAWTYIACPANVGGDGNYAGINFAFNPPATIQLPAGGGTAQVSWSALGPVVQNNLACLPMAFTPQGQPTTTPGQWWEGGTDPLSQTSSSGQITTDTVLKIRCGYNYTPNWDDIVSPLYEVSVLVNVAP